MSNPKFPKSIFGLDGATIYFQALAAASRHIPVIGLSSSTTPDTPDFISPLGTPVYGSVKLGSTDPNKDPQNQYVGIDGNTYTFDTVTITNALVNITMRQNIVETKVQGRPGRIKEYISMDDYEVTITGRFDNSIGKAPRTDVALLNEAIKSQIPIPITNAQANLFGIHYIVIKDVNFPQEPGSYSSQVFLINAVSDIPLDTLFP